MGSKCQKSRDSGPSASCALWPVDLKLTHMDWNPEATLIHFQGQYLTICELDYNVLQGEIQNIPKAKAAVDIGEFCLVEDLSSARWYRGRVQKRKEHLFDVFLIDLGNVLSVDVGHLSSCSNDVFLLPPKIVCGFLANVLLLQSCSHPVLEQYFSSLIGREITGYIQALLPHKVLLLEAPDINDDLVRHGFGRYVDTDTFLLLVGMLTDVPLKQNMEPAPDLLIEKPRGQELCLKPPTSSRYKDILSLYRPRLSCGTRAKVRVTAAVSPRLFCCLMVSMKTDLLEMSKKLAEACESRTKDCSQRSPENLGVLCAVKSKDGKWHRGFVQFLPVNSQVRVLFIDYGFFESVRVENIHRLPPDLYSTPIMAFPCSLSCLSGLDDVVTTQQLRFLRTGLLGGELDMEILSFDEEQHLHNVTLFGADAHVQEPGPTPEVPRRVVETEELSPQGGTLYFETVMGEELCKSLQEEKVQVDSVFVGYVEHVQNPNHFWIRTQKRNDDFEEMMTKMKDHFSQAKLDEDVLLNPEPGKLCCAVYEKDMHFYRGVVTKSFEHGAEVLFLDFGNIEKVPNMLIKNIPEAFASKSAFAFCCTLVNVFPFEEVWTSATSDIFRQAVSNKALLVHVVHVKKHKFVVDLYEMGCDNSQSISDLLISSEQAECWKNTPKNPAVQKNRDAEVKTICQRHPATVDVSTDQWEDEVCNSVKDFVIDGTSTLKRKFIPEANGKEKGLCNDVEPNNTKSQEGLTQRLVEQGRNLAVPTKQMSTESFVYSSYDLIPGNEEQVCVTHVSSQWQVYCHLERNFELIEELENKILEESEKMMQAGTRAVSSELCLAKYLDGHWYRGVAHPVQSPLHLSVFFVDYGNKIVSEKNHVMFIPRDSAVLLCTPMQALRCRLASVSTEELYADVKEWLDSAILNKQVKAVILGKNEDGSLDVELLDGDVNINYKVKELIVSQSPRQKTENTKPKPPTGNTKSPVKHNSQTRGKSRSCTVLKPHRLTQAMYEPPKKRENAKDCVPGKFENSNAKRTQQNKEKTNISSPVKSDTNTHSEQPPETEKAKIPQLPCLPDRKLSAGLRAKCFISHIDSVSSFFLHLSQDEPDILKMAEDLNSSSFRNSLKTASSLRVNGLVLAEYEEDGALYRSVVKDLVGSSRFVVEFVDYGNTAVVEKEKICLMPKEYFSQPRFSISCSLLDTSSFDSDASFTEALMEKHLMVNFACQFGTQWKVQVEVLDEEPPVAPETAVESSPVNESRSEEEASVSSTETEPRGSFSRTEESESGTSASERVIPSMKSENATRDCAETQNETAEVEPSDSDTSVQQLSFAPIDLDKEYSGFADAVTSPFDFCVVLEDLLSIMNNVSVVLADLPARMSPLPEDHLTPGTCCLFKSRRKWCRTQIVHADATVVLHLVDYGLYEYVPYEDRSELKRLPEDLVKLPKVTFPCVLRGVKPLEEDKQWTEEASFFFQQCLYRKNLQIVFREFVSDTHWRVDIVADGVHVAKELVDGGHASYMDVMLGLRFQEQNHWRDERDSKADLSTEEEEWWKEHGTISGAGQCVLI